MFQFPSLPLRTLLDSDASTTALPVVGFPIRRSRGQRSVSTSPGLIAAAHVLLRLLAPRHPPCALILLIVKNITFATMEFSRCTRTFARPTRERPPFLRSAGAPVSQNSAASDPLEVDVDLGEPELGRRSCVSSTRLAASRR